MSSQSGYVYEYVTADRFELPIYVADTVRELAYLVGTTENAISSDICHQRQRGYRCRYKKIFIGKGYAKYDRTD